MAESNLIRLILEADNRKAVSAVRQLSDQLNAQKELVKRSSLENQIAARQLQIS